MKEKYLVKVNGVNHVIFNELVNNKNKDKLLIKFKSYQALPTTVKEINKNLFGIKYIVITVLVPEYYALDYSHSD